MEIATLLDNLAVIADAPGGVQHLRRMVLDLAVSGRLVPQDAEEPPAAVILNQLQAQREDALTELSVRSSKPAVPISDRGSDAEIVPDGWASVRLGDALLVVMGNSPPGDSYNEHGDGVPLINGPVEFSPHPLGRTVLRQFTTEPTRLCEEGDLLVCVRGATTGRTNIAGFPACIGRGVALVRAWQAQPFVNLVMWSVGNRLLASGKGTTFPSISQSDLTALRIRVPPLAEQERIVAKVDELMFLCDELETQQTSRAITSSALRQSVLNGLHRATSRQELSTAWFRVGGSWPAICSSPESIDDLRETITKLATQGWLLAGKPPETPAAGLPGEGITFKGSSLASTPEDWVVCKLGDLISLVSGQHLKPDEYNTTGEGIPYLTGPADFADGGPVPKRWTRTRKAVAQRGDLLLTVKGAGVGKTSVVNLDEAAISRQLMALRPLRVHTSFLVLLVTSLTQAFRAAQVGIAIPGIGRKDVLEAEVLVPPIAQQERIVAKVEELMVRCRDVESRFVRRRDAGAAWAQAATQADLLM